MDNPFLGTLALRSRLVQVDDDDERAPASTDGAHIYYSPKFWLELTAEERKGVMAHEIMHNALLHSFRLKGRDHKKFNVAADYAINEILVNTFNLKLPKDALLDRQYFDLSAEEIYARLPDLPKSDGPGGSGQGWGKVLEAPGKSPAEQKQAEVELQQAVRAAAQVAKQAGKLSGALARALEFLEPKINWKEALREFLTAKLCKDDFRWYPCDMQYLHMDIRVPALAGESFGPVAVCIDTSGSIGPKELSEFLAEVTGILEDCRPEQALVIYCDTEVNRVDAYTVDDLPLKPKVCGGGGTSFRPPFEYLEKNGIEPECLIYLTDMYGDFPKHAPSYPVIWARTTKVNAPFGTHIDLDFN